MISRRYRRLNKKDDRIHILLLKLFYFLKFFKKHSGYYDLLLGADYNWSGQANISDLNNFFNGGIDHLHIWEGLLSDEEILQYMSCPQEGPESGLISFWNFEESNGSVVYGTGSETNGINNGAIYSQGFPQYSSGFPKYS